MRTVPFFYTILPPPLLIKGGEGKKEMWTVVFSIIPLSLDGRGLGRG